MILPTSANFPAPLDSKFQPAILFNRAYVAAAKKSGRAVPLVLGLERENKLVSRFETMVLPDADATTLFYVERLVKCLLWARGGWKLYVGGPKKIGEYLNKHYSSRGARKFDCDMMTAAYGRKFQVVTTTVEKVPAAREMQTVAGGHLKGCRIGFDLGASDYKFSAVMDGQAVFTDEMPWDPKSQANPDYHYHHIVSALHRAAALSAACGRHRRQFGGHHRGQRNPRGLAAARGAKKDFPKAAGIFKRIQKEWNVPVVVMNDGDVTALAGALSLGSKGMLGIAMGSSQAAGFMDPHGRIPGWLNELAFVPVDYQPRAAVDEWSGDRGTGVMYFSQQAVNKLLPAAKISLPEKMGLPERLKEVQNLMDRGDGRAVKIYETIGVYLGCALAQYAEFYEFRQALILGRVTTGKGGDIVIETAREVLKRQFPEVAGKIELRVPDEKSRRVGQAVAAASLPAIKK